MPGESYQHLADQRANFSEELKNPDTRARLFSLTANEVGSQGPLAQQGLIESVFNRASARGQTLREAASDSGYYPARSRRYVPTRTRSTR